MEKEKMKLLFYLKRGTQDKNGKSPVMGRISVGRSMVQFSCKCACTPNLWDSRKQRLVGKSAEAVSVNNELDRLQVSVCKVYEMLLKKSNASVRAEQIKELVFGLNSGSQGLLHHTDEYINRFRDRVGIDRSERRQKCLLLFRKHLAKFLRHRYHVDDIPVQKADTALIKDLEEYFAKEKGFKLNTSAGYLTMLASLLKDLHKRHIIDIYPFIAHSIRWDVGTPRYITREEVNRVAALSDNELQGYEQVSRDMFLFSCYTGLSYTDVYHLTAEHIIHESDMDWIRKPRIKTGNICHIPLLPEASAIIERYRGIHTRAFRHDPPQRVSSAHTRLRYGEHTPQKDSTALRYSENADFSHGKAYLRIADDAFRRRVYRKRIENARTQPNKDHTGVCRDFSRAYFSGCREDYSSHCTISSD
ncbi:site-specific recombinase, phage integrase family [Prevotella veroralis F0319]|uniref:Site-specific recombinase, phage integrase family n=1 Tax=Prevotella veroralis F0319 TaxID=649761 RepID=C9ML28_9BACT|nr:site-specific recombinase, phage integrase family [Prevotella veroralis F0319]